MKIKSGTQILVNEYSKVNTRQELGGSSNRQFRSKHQTSPTSKSLKTNGDCGNRAWTPSRKPRSGATPTLIRYILEALSVYDAGSALVVLVLGDPHLLEGGERGQDRASDPHRVLALGRRHDLHLDGGGRERRHLFGEAHVDVWKHGRP